MLFAILIILEMYNRDHSKCSWDVRIYNVGEYILEGIKSDIFTRMNVLGAE